jgi:glycolate oxidase
MEMPTPDSAVLSRKPRIVARLQEVLGKAGVIHEEAETRAYECDALTAYKCPPLAVVLPSSTEEVAAVMKVCHAEGVPVVPRGAGHVAGRWRAAHGRQRDPRRGAPEPGARDRLRQPLHPGAVGAHQPQRDRRGRGGGFFYAPDPSSQLACAIAGNIAMNSGGAHCLKYGVTTNNLLGVKMVTMEGDMSRLAARTWMPRSMTCSA